MKFSCKLCRNEGWVCEEHPDQPVEHKPNCTVGMPCPVCHPLGECPPIPKDAVILAQVHRAR